MVSIEVAGKSIISVHFYDPRKISPLSFARSGCENSCTSASGFGKLISDAVGGTTKKQFQKTKSLLIPAF